VEISRIDEVEIDTALAGELTTLLRESFPEYPARSYFKVPPHFRFVATEAGTLVGQAGVELRVLRVGDEVVRTLGVSDVCVRTRGRGVASRLLAEVTDLARTRAIDFVVLFADDDRLYARNGWVPATNPLTWVKINEHRTLGIARSEVVAALMVKPVTATPWPAGEVDLLGPVF
jgi:GNAT superfamily N-acetyltransferase